MNKITPKPSIHSWFCNKKTLTFIIALLLADCFFILLDIAHGTVRFFGHYRYDIGHDAGLAEIFQYIKWAVILYFLFRIARARKCILY
ncbi:MAG: hypothetical protein KJN98_05880, partial [Pontiella sp.]|nr:hypothetical protein [Pontiella sp.]